MPVRLNSTGGGSVTLDVPAVGTTTTLNLPTSNGTLLASDGSGNVTVSGTATFSGNATFNAGLVPSSSFLRNRIINGAMAIDQRNAGASFNCSAGAVTFGLDRFYVYPTGAAVTGQRVNPSVTGFPTALRVTGAAGNNYTEIGQRIESVNVADLAGSTVTVSFMAAASVATSVTLITSYANATDNFATITAINSTAVTITSTLTRYSVSVSLPSQAANGVVVGFVFGSGLTSGTFTLTGVQLEVGSVATPLERRQYGQELALCQRYFQSYAAGTFRMDGNAAGAGVSVSGITFSFHTQMRSSPTATGNYSSTTNIGNGPFFGNTPNGTNIGANSSSGGTTMMIMGAMTFAAEL